MINRREFLGLGAGCAVSLAGATRLGCREPRFSRKYAPHLGMFRHHAGGDPIDQIKFLADEGFAALEDSGLRAKSPLLQARMGDELARRGMSMGLFVGLADFGRPTFASGSPELRRGVLRELRSAVETARRVGGRYLAVVPGKSVPGLSRATQTRQASDTLRFCADLSEKHGLVLLLEPISHGADSSRMFLRTASEAADLCRAVGRPSCRLLVDIYQQAVAGEEVPQLLAGTRDVLGYVQLADSPGRLEPGTGEIDFARVFDVLDAIGYRGLLGMEHGNRLAGREGERAVIDAYVALDRDAQRPSDASRAAACQRAMSSGVSSKTSIV
jgi:hydroxypyruvate isomerase